MRNRIAHLIPSRITAQLFLVMVVAMVAMILMVFVGFHFARDDESRESLEYLALRGVQGAVVATRLDGAPERERDAVLKSLLQEMPGLNLKRVDPPPATQVDVTDSPPPPFWPRGRVEFGQGLAMTSSRLEGDNDTGVIRTQIDFQLSDGSLYRTIVEEQISPPIYANPLFLILSFLALSSVLLLVWGTRALVRPLAGLASAVACFGQDTATIVPVAETGPKEVRDAARAFNRMQRRIGELLERRTRMLTAIGHDLRTPLTRLRLRIDLMSDEDQKERNLADLNLMETQLEGALNFLRDGRTGEVSRKLDVPSLLKTIADQYEDMGHHLSVNTPTGIGIDGRGSELNRALTNLIDNALRYAGEISLVADKTETEAIIDVVDRGPGIAVADRERLMEPFERGDDARQIGKGASFGLGLATTRAITLAHGGSFELCDTPGGGLTVRMRLPLA